MRLRHKIGAEDDVKNSKYCISKKEKYFDNENKIELELGMGKGRFISDKAINNPNINFIGIEKYATIVLKAISRFNNIDFPSNLKFLCIDIENIREYFDDGTIDKIYLNFSDPWPKKRHESRRLTHTHFLSIYEKILKSDGIIEFKTDNKDLFDFSLDMVKNSNFELLEWTYDLHNDEKMNINNIMTEYEEKFSSKGNRICKLIAKKKC